MKALFTFILLSIAILISYGQKHEFDITDYKNYLTSKHFGNKTISLDSIHKTKTSGHYPGKVRFIVDTKDDDDNILSGFYTNPYNPTTLNQVKFDIKYHNSGQLKSILTTGEFTDGIDTVDYYEYDTNDSILVEQHRYLLYCGTNEPNDEFRIEYTYNEDNKLIKKLVKIKWNYNTSPRRPFNKWVNQESIDFVYDSGKLIKEITKGNYLFEQDTFSNTVLMPYITKSYYYYSNKLNKTLIEKWDRDDSIFINNIKEEYQYIGDTTIITKYTWDEQNSDWEKRTKTHKYIFIGKENYYVETWIKNQNSWKFSHNTFYYYNGDTLKRIAISISPENNKSINETSYLFDDFEHLIYEKIKLFHNNNWKIYTIKELDYDQYQNPVKITFNTFYSNDTVKLTTRYFWHTKYGEPDGYLPMLQTGNQWNILTIDDHIRPNHTDTTWWTTKYKTEDLTGILREDTAERKVYLKEFNNESVLYDFSMHPGDTLAYYHDSVTINFTIRLDSITNAYFENGQPTRKFNLSAKFNFLNDTIYHPFGYWLEGMGSPEGINPYKHIGFTGDFNTELLLCFKHYGDILYMNHDYETCDENYKAVKDFAIEEISIFPNPAIDLLRIRNIQDTQWEKYEIYDILGNRILSHKISSSRINPIDISSIPRGSYLLKIYSMSPKTIAIGKFIKL